MGSLSYLTGQVLELSSIPQKLIRGEKLPGETYK